MMAAIVVAATMNSTIRTVTTSTLNSIIACLSPPRHCVHAERPDLVVVVVPRVRSVDPETERPQGGRVHVPRPGVGADGAEVVGGDARELVPHAVAQRRPLPVAGEAEPPC